MSHIFFVCLGSGSGSEEDSDDDYSSEEISDEDFGELDSDESEGKDWSDLEREAAEDDEEGSDEDRGKLFFQIQGVLGLHEFLARNKFVLKWALNLCDTEDPRPIPRIRL